MKNTILAGLVLALSVVSSAAMAAPKSGCCDASKCKTACCKVACCDAPCCPKPGAKAAQLAAPKKANATLAKFVKGKKKQGSSCCSDTSCCTK